MKAILKIIEKDINYRLVIQIRTLVRIKTKINQEKKNEIKIFYEDYLIKATLLLSVRDRRI
jgi:hypothetical protein